MLAQTALSESTQFSAARRAKLARGRQIIQSEISALEQLHAQLDERFVSAAEQLVACSGSVIVTGIGKAGIVGQKFSASLSSTGTPSHFLHPAEAVHGDLGSVRPGDVVVLFSYSGETEEVIRLLPLLRHNASQQAQASAQAHPSTESRRPVRRVRPASELPMIAITSHTQSTLARSVEYVVPIGCHAEACTHGLAPTSSTTLMLAMGDALALVASEAKGFTRRQFADFHPAGSLGKQLKLVTEVMRPIQECRVACDELSVREVFVRLSRPGRRTGAIMLVDQNGRLSGIFTDSDLARILERQCDEQLDQPVAKVMSRDYHTINARNYLPDAMQIIADYKISELPVISDDHHPLGIVDITDLVDFAGNHSSPGEVTQQPLSTPTVGVPRILSLLKYSKESR